MLNYVWMTMLLLGFIIGGINGRIEEVTQAAFSSAQGAVELSISLLGIMCLWSGMMNIAGKSGLIKVIARSTRPLLRFLFPKLAKNDDALCAIVMNISANFLGLGNAATPLGIKAMNEMQKVNPEPETASDPMCMFLILNTSAIQLIPTTIIALRGKFGSAAPSEIMICIWVASFCSMIIGILMVILLQRRKSVNSLKTAYYGKRLTTKNGVL